MDSAPYAGSFYPITLLKRIVHRDTRDRKAKIVRGGFFVPIFPYFGAFDPVALEADTLLKMKPASPQCAQYFTKSVVRNIVLLFSLLQRGWLSSVERRPFVPNTVSNDVGFPQHRTILDLTILTHNLIT